MQILKSRTPSVADLNAAKADGEAKAKAFRAKIAELESQAAEMLSGDDAAAKKWRRVISEQREELDLIEQRLALLATKVPEAIAREAHEALVAERKKAEKAAQKIRDLELKYAEQAAALASTMAEIKDRATVIYAFNRKVQEISFKTGELPLDLERVKEPAAIVEPRAIWGRVRLPSLTGYGAGVDGSEGYWPAPRPVAEALAAE